MCLTAERASGAGFKGMLHSCKSAQGRLQVLPLATAWAVVMPTNVLQQGSPALDASAWLAFLC